MVAQRKKRKGNPVTHNNSNSLQVIWNKSLEPERLIWVLSYLFLWIDWFRWFYLFPLVNGGWSIWSSWTSCNQSCGIGSPERSRNCTWPSPSYGGKPCQGAKRETQMCNKQLRPGRNAIQRIPRILNSLTDIIVIFDNFVPLLLLFFTDKRSFLSKVFKCSYFMIHALFFVIQQPLFNVQPSWLFNKLKVRGGLDNVAGKSGVDELNSYLFN